ncbi:hypothetical protein HELRODRAFT_160456 [Helobdella robusta]|uniref:Ion transport N-terminal domain-containing protein n=1 Tax=Helobdella robusta TaxID=6412 RepID=T1EQ97_HELRO|nr:hypothetical protein HELRODRAFT_160456 [Helobdella robusta]ESO06293.1 hypothetical protein HELRODRAFT_160456 [Helobdella robusta]
MDKSTTLHTVVVVEKYAVQNKEGNVDADDSERLQPAYFISTVVTNIIVITIFTGLHPNNAIFKHFHTIYIPIIASNISNNIIILYLLHFLLKYPTLFRRMLQTHQQQDLPANSHTTYSTSKISAGPDQASNLQPSKLCANDENVYPCSNLKKQYENDLIMNNILGFSKHQKLPQQQQLQQQQSENNDEHCYIKNDYLRAKSLNCCSDEQSCEDVKNYGVDETLYQPTNDIDVCKEKELSMSSALQPDRDQRCGHHSSKCSFLINHNYCKIESSMNELIGSCTTNVNNNEICLMCKRKLEALSKNENSIDNLFLQKRLDDQLLSNLTSRTSYLLQKCDSPVDDYLCLSAYQMTYFSSSGSKNNLGSLNKNDNIRNPASPRMPSSHNNFKTSSLKETNKTISSLLNFGTGGLKKKLLKDQQRRASSRISSSGKIRYRTVNMEEADNKVNSDSELSGIEVIIDKEDSNRNISSCNRLCNIDATNYTTTQQQQQRLQNDIITSSLDHVHSNDILSNHSKFGSQSKDFDMLHKPFNEKRFESSEKAKIFKEDFNFLNMSPSMKSQCEPKAGPNSPLKHPNSNFLREHLVSFFQPSDNNKLAMKLFGNQNALNREKLRQKAAGSLVIHPCSNFSTPTHNSRLNWCRGTEEHINMNMNTCLLFLRGVHEQEHISTMFTRSA